MRPLLREASGTTPAGQARPATTAEHVRAAPAVHLDEPTNGWRAFTCLYKLLHTATALAARATVLSVDAVGAYDHVSRQGLRSRPALAPLLPFACQFMQRQRLHLARRDRHRA
eukprot:s1908_g8.t1